MLSWPVFWAAVAAAFVLGGTFGVMILSLCVVAGDADRQMERERRCASRGGRMFRGLRLPGSD